MLGWAGTAFSWLCFLHTASCFSLEGVDDSILFKIRWKEPLGSIKDIHGGEGFETVKMMSADKEPFVCYVPRKLQVEGDDTDVRNYQGPTPYELLEPLFANKVCRYKLDSYWTYQLCHGRSLRQYHEDTIASKVAIMEFYLGKSDAETRKREHEIYKRELEEKLKALEEPVPKPVDADSEKVAPEKAYSGSNDSAEPTPLTPIIKLDGVDYPSFIMNMSYGTLCDINGKPRFTQVHYICDELSDHDISLFEETSTCMYRVVVRTPLLCKHPMYRVGTTPENEISCHRAGKESSEAIDGEVSPEELPLRSDDGEADENQPRRLQEMEQENRDFRKSSAVDADGGHYDSDFKNLVEAIERNLKIFFLQDEEDERGERPSHDVKNILGILSGQTCLTGGSGWWRYEFCYGKRVTQYHLEKGERAQEILLGRWDEAKHRQWVNANSFRKVPPDPLYVKHFYSDGDTCSVTGLPRTVVVKLACKAVPGHPDAVSISLQEPKPCEYKLTVESTIICDLLTNVDEHGLPEQLSPANGHKPKAPTTTEAQQSKGERKEDVPPTPAV